jgi:tRNA(Phe) wybutosine-synthesizing methylase Tyw3
MAARKAAKPKKPNINSAADELIRMAEEGGVEQNFFFTTTFNRYKVQLNTLTRLQQEISNGELLISKEYVKGRVNLVANPAITEYNKTSTAANQTVQTLLKIITTFADGPVMSTSSAAGDDCDL